MGRAVFASGQTVSSQAVILDPPARLCPASAFVSLLHQKRIFDLNVSGQTIFERLLAITARFGRAGSFRKYADEEPPLRSDLFNADQMEQHGKNLAGGHRLAPGRVRDQLLTRLAENERVLVEVCDLLTAAVTANRRISPAAEWLLDNFYLIDEQIRTAKRHLPKGYSRELPRLAHGPSAKLPRVYDLAFEAISHGDGRIDAESHPFRACTKR
jgi:hypothetical protein